MQNGTIHSTPLRLSDTASTVSASSNARSQQYCQCATKHEANHQLLEASAELAPAIGGMLNHLTTAQIALTDMLRLNDNHGFTPTTETASAILSRKTITAEAVRNTVELAAELVGGPGFSRGHPVERNIRDVRAMHFHPLPSRRQHILSGRVALGFDPVAAQE